ncbi:hypothetical protein UCRPC4_g00107 [Phaeomoniella chlamydospora]|uniref:Uncharacterized protein n=1 Tax=Phaeomoniella chlamydospora TaxID=158046 RepID=A0A0G2F4M1_PHACM|nr:hypothetical protein UCRPC4_g00107 [Phaeomoniella chlamydospora]
MGTDERLAVVVEPSQVRLLPGDEDPYKWDRVEEKEHLFQKNLSDLSIRALRELIESIGDSVAASWKSPRAELAAKGIENVSTKTQKSRHPFLLTNSVSPQYPPSLDSDIGFSAKINDLQQVKNELIGERDIWKTKAEAEAAMRRDVEEASSQLKTTADELEEENRRLEIRINEMKLLLEQSRLNTMQYRGVVNTILRMVQGLKRNVPQGSQKEIMRDNDDNC